MVAEIRDRGPMTLLRYMELALYHPEWGYYARGDERVGREGDFFTSVSVGPLFGSLLARRFAAEFCALNRPLRWRVTEFGGNDGKLADDVLEAMHRIDPAAWRALEYVVCEPLPRMRWVQSQRLARWGDRVRIIGSPDELAGERWPGVVMGNEVLDALPFHGVEYCEGRWVERRVDWTEEQGFHLIRAGAPGHDVMEWLEQATARMTLPDGWQCEVRTGWRTFLQQALACGVDPLMIWIDYGYERVDLVHPHRREGTWRAYRRHRLEPAPWDAPGECDLTAHVDFTGVMEAAAQLGGRRVEWSSQGAWLTRWAAAELAEREGTLDPSWVRQFQTLTHPAHLGARFHVLECAWRHE
jgi:SAM-dependent MidA family methyltransferase